VQKTLRKHFDTGAHGLHVEAMSNRTASGDLSFAVYFDSKKNMHRACRNIKGLPRPWAMRQGNSRERERERERERKTERDSGKWRQRRKTKICHLRHDISAIWQFASTLAASTRNISNLINQSIHPSIHQSINLTSKQSII
jgi:hypothetical protein